MRPALGDAQRTVSSLICIGPLLSFVIPVMGSHSNFHPSTDAEHGGRVSPEARRLVSDERRFRSPAGGASPPPPAAASSFASLLPPQPIFYFRNASTRRGNGAPN